jgi:hypothetical protein
MSIFSNILDKLGIHKPAAQAAPAPAAAKPAAAPPAADKPMTFTPTAAFHPNQPPASSTPPAPTPAAPAPTAPKAAPMAMVDVVSKLDNLAGDNPGLDWKVSIVDLLKLLGMDSSLTARKELATELGCPPDLMGGDYSKMNIWLHKTVLQKIAENGGNIPKELLS